MGGLSLTGKRVLVTGGRDNYDFILIYRAVRDNLQEGEVLVHGAANGTDLIAARSAQYLGVETEPQPAAGPIRNERMLSLGVDLALIFSGGKGTKDMESRLVKAEIPCLYYPSS